MGVLGGGGGGEHWTLWFLPYNAHEVMILFFFIKDRSSLQYFITFTKDGSEFYVPYLSHYMSF